MNDLLSTSFSLFRKQEQSPPHSSNQIVGDDIEMGANGAGNNLNSFFADVAVIKDELAAMEALYTQLQISHEKSKTLYTARAVKDLRNKMDNDVNQSLIKAKFIKLRLEALDKSNVANRTISDSGPGSTTDRTRTSVVDGMRKKLRDDMNLFNELRQRISVEYRETVQRRYYTVTGENPDEAILDSLISSGESELFLQKAIQQQGRGQVMDTIIEIQERHDAVREIEKNLRELHQVFVDMAVLVDSQGVEINDIETQVKRANSYVNSGVGQLQVARKHQKNTRKWTCFAIILLLVIVAIIVLSIRPWSK